ncbi:hypothetical protein [Parasphingopyxis marina]|uniref:Uncharacterized protein n=1 Tax=Parasphingopyxis marina TaxID=2761622 RepID=A0A842I2G2_9SPHN|nr:hypothetical protein [Parasphingopyxis marina]MBC2779051.1 hypothetical protein [Parasphingopyxis marina]
MMIVSLALMLQSAGPVAARGNTGCESGDGEIVVCAQGDSADQFRIPRELREERDAPPETGLVIPITDDINANLHVESVGVGGFTSERAMVTFTLPF